jgi:cytochrome c-type biogenesis protein CcsB
MEKKITSFLFSTRLMAFLFMAFAIAMIAGTLIESKYNTDTARILIYNAWWFEGIMLFFMINFLGNIKRYQLYKKEKWATLILHLAFIFILIGAFITRYFSYEGMMPIREKAAENQFFSEKTFLTIFVDGSYQGQMKRKTIEKPLLFSAAPLVNNYFKISDKFDQIPFEVAFQDFVMGATETIKKDNSGTLYLKLVEAGGGTRHEHYLKEGEVQNIHNVLFALNKFTQGAINIAVKNDEYAIQTPFDGNFMRMADKMQGKVNKDQTEPLMLRSLYNLGGTQFVFPELATKGVKTYVSNGDYKDQMTNDALVLKISNQNQEKTITLVGSKGAVGEPQVFKIGDLDYTVFFGSKIYQLPFQIKLNKFIATKYPGTEKSYAAFESQVTVNDPEKSFDTRIYMNHVLDHKGYRFFQASFDDDEKGTKLSVNHDFWGTWITYIGYFLLFFGLMSIMFTKNSRFADLKRKLEVVKVKKSKLISIVIVLFSLQGLSQNHKTVPPNDDQIISIINKYKVSEKHANKFGRLIVQDAGGRMKPINTFSSELLRKVSHSNVFNTMNADQVFLSITQFPTIWYEVKLIYLKSGNDSIRKIIGIDAKQKYARFLDFFDGKGNYKLSKYLDKAYKAANPNQFEKEFVEADKKVNLLNSALSGSILKIFPIPNDQNNKWVSYPELNQAAIKGKDSLFTKQILPIYFEALSNAVSTQQYKASDFYLDGISKFQLKYGKAVMPSQDKISSEILYNKYDILQKLPYWYLSAAILMLFFVILAIFKERKGLAFLINFMHIVIGVLFGLHTITLMARWYISGHAPWSNAYEAIVYVAWATMFFGLAFDIKSKLTVASSAFVSAMILTAAYANWIDPEIANLQPVLNSYWLMIHVAVIVASYGPFALGMILGFVALLLILFTNEKNKEKMSLNIKEITYINEMSLTIGLIMLTIGNFLGGQWANESWGRYWGWDPKETWALISIMIYAFVIHARFVPALRGKWIFNLMSMYAFISILFTYYGVNFHLTGLHSYASGEAKSLNWIWESLLTITVIGLLAYPNYIKHYKKRM